MISWLRRRFITGFFVTVPLIISVAALVWIFRVIDGITEPLVSQWVGRAVPGLGLAMTGLLVLLVGVTATNMVGKRVLQRAEAGLLHIPLFRTVYAPVKQLVAAFSPDNEYGFKRVVLVQEPGRGYVLGFLTREFTLQGIHGADTQCWRCTSRPITSIWVTSWSTHPSGCCFRSSRWRMACAFC